MRDDQAYTTIHICGYVVVKQLHNIFALLIRILKNSSICYLVCKSLGVSDRRSVVIIERSVRPISSMHLQANAELAVVI